MDTVTEAYLAFAIMTLVGIGFPVGAFIASYFLRPIEDPNDRTKVDPYFYLDTTGTIPYTLGPQQPTSAAQSP